MLNDQMTADTDNSLAIPVNVAGTAPAVLFSLVVATYRRTTEFGAMVQSLLAQTERRFELIVADQNPDDRLVPLLEPAIRAGIPVTHIKLSVPALSAARNAGIAKARGEFIAFPDDDCWFEPAVFSRALGAFQANAKLDGLVGHWVEQDPNGKRPPETLALNAWRKFRGGVAPSFVLFFRTSRVREIGGFFEALGVGRYFGAAEEDDVILRLLETGSRIDYAPDIEIHHRYNHVAKFNAQQCHRNRSYGRGTGAVQAKHRLPLWVIGRGLIGPLYHGLRSPNPASGLVLGTYTAWGRIEGLAGWWLWGRRLLSGNSTQASR